MGAGGGQQRPGGQGGKLILLASRLLEAEEGYLLPISLHWLSASMELGGLSFVSNHEMNPARQSYYFPLQVKGWGSKRLSYLSKVTQPIGRNVKI